MTKTYTTSLIHILPLSTQFIYIYDDIGESLIKALCEGQFCERKFQPKRINNEHFKSTSKIIYNQYGLFVCVMLAIFWHIATYCIFPV